MLRGPFLCAATFAFGVISTAHAEPAFDACARAYEGAQQLIRAGALLKSRADLTACTNACPSALVKDCATWQKEVDREIPSLQVSAKVADGSDPGVVRVMVDGALVAEALTGAPIAVDPGKHVLTFETSALPRVEVSVDVPKGRKGYAVDVSFPAAAVAVAVPRPPPPRERPPTRRSIGPIVIGSLGLAALGVGAGLGLKGQIDRSQLVHTCAPHCAQGAVDAIGREWTLGAGIAAAGGSVALAGMLWWLLDGPPKHGAALMLLPGAGWAGQRSGLGVSPIGARTLTLAGRF